MDFRDILQKPQVSEKSVRGMEKGKYVFVVSKDTGKVLIRQAVEKLFNVHVNHVRTVSVHGKQKLYRGQRGFTKGYKKAIVTLKEGEKIEVFTGA